MTQLAIQHTNIIMFFDLGDHNSSITNLIEISEKIPNNPFSSLLVLVVAETEVAVAEVTEAATATAVAIAADTEVTEEEVMTIIATEGHPRLTIAVVEGEEGGNIDPDLDLILLVSLVFNQIYFKLGIISILMGIKYKLFLHYLSGRY